MRTALLALLLCATVAHADLRPYPNMTFTARLVCGGGVDCERAQHAFRLARAYIQESTGVTFKLVEVIEIKEEMKGDSLEQLLKWAVRVGAVAKVKADMTLVSLTAFSPLSDYVDPSSENTLGMASGIGVIGPEPCGAFARLIGSDVLAAKVMIHEIGHLLGATHGDAGLMFPTVDVNQYSDSYSRESLEEITKHLISLVRKTG